jgi:hypothetical protein
LKKAPLAEYGEFKATHFIRIIAWRDFYALKYADVFGGVHRVVAPSNKGKEKKEEGTNKSEDEDQKLREVVNPPPFNPKSQFFVQLL